MTQSSGSRTRAASRRKRQPVRSFAPDPTLPRGSTLLGLPGVSAEPVPTVDVLLWGVPTDRGAVGRRGAHSGPAAVRSMSWIGGGYSQALGIDTYRELGAADGGDLQDPGNGIEDVLGHVQERVAALSRGGVVSALVGGDQTITLGALRGIRQAKRRPVGMLHVDAFHDACPEVGGGSRSRGSPNERSVVRCILEEKLVRAESFLQVGVRGPCPDGSEHSLALGSGVEVVTMDEVRWDVHSAVSQVRRLVGRGALYVSIDLCALDPSAAPGVSIPAPGGMTTWELQQILRALVGADIVGFDVVGLVPSCDSGQLGASAAVVVLQEILSVIADTRRSARPALSSRGRRPGRRSA